VEQALRAAIAGLEPGDVLHLPWAGKRGLVAVVGVHLTRKGTPIAQIVTDERALTKVGPVSSTGCPSRSSGSASPGSGNPRQQDYRKTSPAVLRALDPPWVAPEVDGPAAHCSRH
jgi:ATP-dependent RNA helicase HelY